MREIIERMTALTAKYNLTEDQQATAWLLMSLTQARS